jgi:transposase-like protein
MAKEEEGSQVMKWKDMTGEERYRIVEMAQKGDLSQAEICRTFEVSRQTLHKAMIQVSQAAVKALEPQTPGRKGKSPEQVQIGELTQKTTGLEKEVNHWKTRYEVAQAFIDLSRESKQKETRRQKKKQRRSAKKVYQARPAGSVASLDDGQGSRDTETKPGEVDEQG